MMDPDKDLPFGDLDRISLDDDPRARAQKAAPPRDAQTQSVPAAPAPSKPQKNAAARPRQASSGKWLPLLVGVLLVALIGLGGWAYTQIGVLQERLNQQQSQASNQLDTLKSQISATGDSTSATASKLGDSLADHGKELARLSANDVATRRRLSKLEDTADKLEASIKKLNALNAELEVLQKQQKLADISASQLQMQQDLNSSAVKKFGVTAEAQAKQLKALATTPADVAALKKQLHDAQEAIHAFDKWRVQVNGQLNAKPHP